jgi:glycosyltransferase involved in cell wall biosynthesis
VSDTAKRRTRVTSSVRVILVVPACPHPFGDTAAKWFDVLVRELVRRGHAVDLLCVTEEPPARMDESRRALEAVAATGPGALTTTFQSLTISRPAFRRKLQSARRPFSEIEQADGVRHTFDACVARGYDVLHLEQLWTGWLGDGADRGLLNVHHLEVIDLDGSRGTSWGERKQRWQIGRATTAILARAPRVRFFTDRLAQRARAYNPAARHWVVPFALDLARYEPVPLPADPVVGLIGSMQWPPSRAAAERLITRIWPLVRAAVPQARLLVAGWNAHRYLAAFAGTPGLELQSDLAHPRDFFARTAVLAYALGRGSGMKIKVMEAMAFGVPVVTTTEGIEGLDAEPGIHVRVADDDDEFAAHVVDLLRDRAAARRTATAARALIADVYNPQSVVDRMIDVYRDVSVMS